MGVTMFVWLSVDLRTGVVLEELADLKVSSVSQTIGAYTSTTASLPVPTAPELWERATRPGAAALILLDDPQDGTPPVPLWGGMVTGRDRGGGDTVELSLATVEAYLDRRYVGDVDYPAWGQNAIVADLIDRFVDDTFPLRVAQLGGAGTLRDRLGLYRDAADKTVLAAISELMGVDGGPEWTITWEHRTAPERYTPVLTVGARLGSGPIAGLAPAATFDMPGSVSEVSFVEDYSAGKGATKVIATSSASDTVRPQSPPQTSGDAVRPTFEFRWAPSSSISDIATLTQHALAALAAMRDGAQSIALTAVVEPETPRLGVDWFLGDTVGYAIGGIDEQGAELVPAFPGGMTGSARVWGWVLDLDEPVKVSPILVQEG